MNQMFFYLIEAVQFARDTAVERRHLTSAQKLNIILNSEDIISELQERARENSLKNLKQNEPTGSEEPIGKSTKKEDTRTNTELDYWTHS